MVFTLGIIFFVFGLIIGSFLNVVIIRFKTERSFNGRSSCMTCSKKLAWYELIPLVSFFGLKGRCRTCKTKISIQYPIVELISGLFFTLIFLKFQDIFYINTIGFSISYAYYTTMFSILLVIAVYDFKHKIIPEILSLVVGIFAFFGLFFFQDYLFIPHIPKILEFLSGIFLALPFAFFWLVSKGTWMGLGDAKLALGLGWLLGFTHLLSGTVVAFWLGAIVGLILIIFSKKYGIKSEIPFAPFLVLGMFIAFLFELQLFHFSF